MRKASKEKAGNHDLDRAIIDMATASGPVLKPEVYASLSFDIPVEFKLK